MPWPFSEVVDMMMYKIEAWRRSSAFLIGCALDRVKGNNPVFYKCSTIFFNIHRRPRKIQSDIKMMYGKSGILLQHILLFVCCLCTLVIIYDRITLVIIYDSCFMLNAAVGGRMEVCLSFKNWLWAWLQCPSWVFSWAARHSKKPRFVHCPNN